MLKYERVVIFCVFALLPTVAWGALPTVPDLIEVTENSILRWNFGSSDDVYVRNSGTSIFGDMTRLNDGRYVAYRTTYTGATAALLEINPETGASSVVVQSSRAAGEVVALAPMRNGRLFADDNSLGYLSIDPTTLAYTRISISGAGNTGGMATSPDGEIYAWCSGVGNSGIFAELFQIDPTNGTAQVIGGYSGGLTASQHFNAMSFTPDGRLFGFTEINGGNGGGPFIPNGIYELDLQTGIPTLLAQRPELADVRGVVFVPEPGGALVFTVGIASLLCRVRRAGACHDEVRD